MLRFRNRLLAICVLGFALATGAAQAQKFAIINMQQAMLATSDGKKASQAISEKFTPVRNTIDQLMKDIQAKQEAFSKGRATMTPAAATAAQRELETLTTSLKRQQEDAEQDLQETQSRQFGPIAPKLQQIISQYAAANQITFVIDTSADPNNLIYGDASLNISAAVVAAYEKAAGGTAPPAATGAGAVPPPTAATKPPAVVTPRSSPATGAPKTPTPAPKTPGK